MSNNLRSRRAYHNTFGDAIPENKTHEPIPHLARSFQNNSISSNHFDNQTQLSHASSINTFAGEQVSPNSINSYLNNDQAYATANLGYSDSPSNSNVPYNSRVHVSIPQREPMNVVYANAVPTYPIDQSVSNNSFNNTRPLYNNVTGYTNVPYNSVYSNEPFPRQGNSSNRTYPDVNKSPSFLNNDPSGFNVMGDQNNYPIVSEAQCEQDRGLIQGTAQSYTNVWDEHNPFAVLPGPIGQQLTKFGQIYNDRVRMAEELDLVDPPLLEELGIDPIDIFNHIKAIIFLSKEKDMFLNYSDLSGPLFIFVVLCSLLMLSGKLCFSIIYAMSLYTNISLYFLFNFMSPSSTYINFTKIVTISGYSLLPICFTPIIWLFSRYIKKLCIVLVGLCIVWSSSSASYLYQMELNMQDKKWLVFYPTLLFYATFANITIF